MCVMDLANCQVCLVAIMGHALLSAAFLVLIVLVTIVIALVIVLLLTACVCSLLQLL